MPQVCGYMTVASSRPARMVSSSDLAASLNYEYQLALVAHQLVAQSRNTGNKVLFQLAEYDNPGGIRLQERFLSRYILSKVIHHGYNFIYRSCYQWRALIWNYMGAGY